MKADFGLVYKHKGPSVVALASFKRKHPIDHLLLSRTQSINRNLFATLPENDFLMSVPVLNPVVAQIIEHHPECTGEARNALLNTKFSNASIRIVSGGV